MEFQLINDGFSADFIDGFWNDIVMVFGLTNTLFNNLTTIVRKCAHAFEYFVLGILLLNAIRQIWSAKRKKSWVRYWYLAVVGASVYAVTDEAHQAFVSGRSCELRDIVIDALAAGVGVGVVMLIRRWRKAFSNREDKQLIDGAA